MALWKIHALLLTFSPLSTSLLIFFLIQARGTRFLMPISPKLLLPLSIIQPTPNSPCETSPAPRLNLYVTLPIFLTVPAEFFFINIHPVPPLLVLELLKALYWGHYCFLFLLLTFRRKTIFNSRKGPYIIYLNLVFAALCSLGNKLIYSDSLVLCEQADYKCQ